MNKMIGEMRRLLGESSEIEKVLKDVEANISKAVRLLEGAQADVKTAAEMRPKTGQDDSEGRHFIYDDAVRRKLNTLAYALGSKTGVLKKAFEDQIEDVRDAAKE